MRGQQEWRVAFLQRRWHHAFFASEHAARHFAASLEEAQFVVTPSIEHWDGSRWSALEPLRHSA